MILRIEPLDGRHDRLGFACGVEPLDRYFHVQASQDARRRIASCFVLVDDGLVPLAYHTVASTSVALSDLPAGLIKKLPRYPAVPAILLGRLAVDHRHRGRRLGEHMLMDALARSLRSDIAAYAIVVDAKDRQAAAFYQAYDFQFLASSETRLFLPMAKAAKLFA